MASIIPSDREALAALGDLLVLVEPHLLRLWKADHLTLVQLRVLRALAEGTASPGDLATRVGVTAPAMARTLAKLEARGLVARSIDPSDRRRVTVELSDEGRHLNSTSRMWDGTPLHHAVAELSPTARVALVGALRQLSASARAFDASAATAEARA